LKIIGNDKKTCGLQEVSAYNLFQQGVLHISCMFPYSELFNPAE